MSLPDFDIEEVKNFIQNTSEETKIYIGADSSRYRFDGKWFVEYSTVVVVHLNGKNGCKIFGRTNRERDYDNKASKPKIRMMTEAIKAAEMFLELEEAIEYRECEIHLDIASDPKYGSYVACNAAVGYVQSMCNIVPMVKPNSPIAGVAADRFTSLYRKTG